LDDLKKKRPGAHKTVVNTGCPAIEKNKKKKKENQSRGKVNLNGREEGSKAERGRKGGEGLQRMSEKGGVVSHTKKKRETSIRHEKGIFWGFETQIARQNN